MNQSRTGVPGTYIPPEYRQRGPYAQQLCWMRSGWPYILSLGPGKLITDHCLVRGLNDTYKQFFTSSAVANATRLPTFELFRVELEGKPRTPIHKMHNGGHVSIRGEMTMFYSSPAGRSLLEL
jgi:tyrosinase